MVTNSYFLIKGIHPDNLYTEYEKQQLMQKAMALRLVYVHVLEAMGMDISWNECCEEAANALQDATSIAVSC